MNIVGEGFPEKIRNQITQRQQIYGSGYIEGTSRSSEEILYLNANTSWCKLISSVDIVDIDNIQNSSLKGIKELNGNSLAQRFVLFNGTFDINDGEQKAGIDLTKSLLGYNYAYGIGGTEFGLRPMMGIQSAEIKHANRGSIRQATVKIKAWNKIQFDIIDILYLRLGFDILLEWGHTMWYDDKKELHKGSDIDLSLAKEFLTGKGLKNENLTYESFLDLIQKQKIKSCGNYDAMFAKVVNFHWTFNKDGSYDITLDLISVGDIVESFKINVLANNTLTQNSNISGSNLAEKSDKALISYFANKHDIGQWFYTLTYGHKNVISNKEITNAAKEAAISTTIQVSAAAGNPAAIAIKAIQNLFE